MSTYQTNEGTFNVPDGWHDQSVTIFGTALGEDSTANLVMVREPRVPDETLEAYVLRQIEQFANQLPDFALHRQNATTLDREPAVELEFSWLTDGGLMRQRQIYVFWQRIVLSITVSARREMFAQHEPTLRKTLESFRFRR